MSSGLRLQPRDIQAIKFVAQNPCYSDTICKLYYNNNINVCNKRLTKMTDYGYLNRTRNYIGEAYFYYVDTKTPPHQRIHLDLVAKSYLFLSTLGRILEWEREPTDLSNIIPDAKALITQDDITGIIYVEVERYHNCLKQKIKLYEDNYNPDNPFSLLYFCNDNYSVSSPIPVIQVTLDTLVSTTLN